MKLFLCSSNTTPDQDNALTTLVGKMPQETKVAYIENAFDVYEDEVWLAQRREEVINKGYDVELVDLRNWENDRNGLREKLASKDMFWLSGGNTYYLRWLMKEIGATEIITELVKQGKVYVGISAGAIIAGPTLQFFEALDDPGEAKEPIFEGLNLTHIVVVPHMDDIDLTEASKKVVKQLKTAGYTVQPLMDGQVLLIDGDKHQVI